jgi:hypothetical protein
MNYRPALLAAAALATAFGICVALYRWGTGGNRDLWTLARAIGHGEELESHHFEVDRARLDASLIPDSSRLTPRGGEPFPGGTGTNFRAGSTMPVTIQNAAGNLSPSGGSRS